MKSFEVTTSQLFPESCTLFVATAHASSYYVMGLMDRDIYRGFPENFGSRSIFLAHDYLTVYKNTSKLIV